ncbi:MAG: NAD(P)-binding protein, partial [Bacteroidetes bacterium]|nr:NAD(P)-binding protein [Bacteroidota bacterium]
MPHFLFLIGYQMTTENKYAIIGGGPAGLSSAKNLKEQGIPFDAYEAAEDLGGLWNIQNKNSTV